MTTKLDITAEQLIEYLEHPKELQYVSYTTLKNWSNLFPFCQNLRYLVVQKSKMDQQKAYPKDLELAATYSIDRSLLHRQIELHPLKYHTSEDTLDLEEDTLILQDIPQAETIIIDQDQPTASTPPSDNFEFIIPDVAAKEETPVLDLTQDNFIENNSETSDTSLECVPDHLETEELTIIERLLSDIPRVEIEEDDELLEEQADLNDIYLDPPMEVNPAIEVSESDEEPNLIDVILDSTPVEDDDNHAAFSLGEMAPKGLNEHVSSHEEIHNYEEEIRFIEPADPDEQQSDISPSLEELPNIESKELEKNKEEKVDYKNPIDTSPQPVPKQSFSSWLKSYKPVSAIKTDPLEKIDKPVPTIKKKKLKVKKVDLEKRNKKIKKLIKANKKKAKVKKKKKVNSPATELANKSIMDSEEIISQTLADLLAAQGYSDKAIKMYERLSLIFPEKSSFFANKIKELSYFNE